MDNLQQLEKESIEKINASLTIADLESIRVGLLGKAGTLTQSMKTLGSLSDDDRRTAGALLNTIKSNITACLDNKRQIIMDAQMKAKLQSERIDVSLPVTGELTRGKIHPISQTLDLITTILGSMGFEFADGPDIEDDFYNFTALNFPPNHPARQTHDTFFFDATVGSRKNTHDDGSQLLLRTHTSPVQVRALMNGVLPLKIMAPGRTYRCDSDQTHTPMFHQVEGLYIDRSVHMGHLKGCLTEFLQSFFDHPDLNIRFRPSFFPFTEPSAEVDIGCLRDGGRIQIGEGNDWLEILGCGMVHPNVLRHCGVDPNEYQGFAFGMGVERMAMLKYGIGDLRTLYESDLRWLDGFGFDPLQSPK